MIRRVTFRAALGTAFFGLLIILAAAAMLGPVRGHEGHIGHGHEKWHAPFYSKLMIPGTKTSCCNLSDCRPTSIRANGDHYEIKKDGRWVRVPLDKIVKVTAPDGGAHICAPDSKSGAYGADHIFCVVMPMEG